MVYRSTATPPLGQHGVGTTSIVHTFWSILLTRDTGHSRHGPAPYPLPLPPPAVDPWPTLYPDAGMGRGTTNRPCYHPQIRRPNEVGLDFRVCVPPTLLPPKKNPCHRMLSITPISLEEANAFVQIHHRHHKPVVGHKFSIAVSEEDKVVGVAIVGRPVSRMLDNGWVLEVNRCCTDGTKNACSMLYGAAWRAAKALGYRRLITYTLPGEGGASLKASGWTCVGERGGGNWNCKSRPRIDTDELLRGQKLLWEAA